MTVNLSEARAKLSKLIDLAIRGESVTIAKNNLPLVDLVPHKVGGGRKLGLLRGKVSVPEDFDAESDEINLLFYGNADGSDT